MLPWSRPDWREEVLAWIDGHVERTGPEELLHERAWSPMLRVPTRDGDAYLKAVSPALAHEPALTQALTRLRPVCTAGLIAIDPVQGLMLMRDSGGAFVPGQEQHLGPTPLRAAPRAPG